MKMNTARKERRTELPGEGRSEAGIQRERWDEEKKEHLAGQVRSTRYIIKNTQYYMWYGLIEHSYITPYTVQNKQYSYRPEFHVS